MDPQTYLTTYRANEARRAVETERRRQIGERLSHETDRPEASRRSRVRGVARRLTR
ncbi:hypothetical protein Xcel_2195 [Xylanimonas cellulosilytica DSM 15894]|uniref:Uncharacterized protein n=1 Tax=Xylanimonas cellulosilytica (strain DSM 15894 / JCM 12276 / CECT 5975 / KCTC 9989 / LMG 20990 / NBRC 107835 / XIL07) TaxID=446471 RepID=D1BUX4_XYLCX|nr:hypothetical protein [Xylanimonas cellulosilytica]ACZ31213.1 hypothetical protein Xcel_2195 [Xylanimonas cellulosilytica DSM 15894]